MVNLEYYRTFYQVAALGSMGRAAEEMCLTPPTVTKTIQALEQQLGCQLFTRSPRGVKLTAAGELLFARVKPGLNILNAGEHEINMLNSLEGGAVRIGMSEAAAHYFTMPAVLGDFCMRYPKVRLIIRHLTAAEAEAGILDGDIDFAIMGVSGEQNTERFDSRVIYQTANIPVVGKKYSRLASGPVSLEALAGHPLIFTHRGYSIREYYTHLYERHGLKFSPNIETPTLDIQIKAVCLGLGYSFVPSSHVQSQLDDGTLLRLKILGETDIIRPVCLITARDIPMSRAAETLVDVLLSAADGYMGAS